MFGSTWGVESRSGVHCPVALNRSDEETVSVSQTRTWVFLCWVRQTVFSPTSSCSNLVGHQPGVLHSDIPANRVQLEVLEQITKVQSQVKLKKKKKDSEGMCCQSVPCFHTVPLLSDRRHRRRSRTSQRVHEVVVAMRSRSQGRRWVKGAKKGSTSGARTKLTSCRFREHVP